MKTDLPSRRKPAPPQPAGGQAAAAVPAVCRAAAPCLLQSPARAVRPGREQAEGGGGREGDWGRGGDRREREGKRQPAPRLPCPHSTLAAVASLHNHEPYLKEHFKSQSPTRPKLFLHLRCTEDAESRVRGAQAAAEPGGLASPLRFLGVPRGSGQGLESSPVQQSNWSQCPLRLQQTGMHVTSQWLDPTPPGGVPHPWQTHPPRTAGGV